MKLHTRVD